MAEDRKDKAQYVLRLPRPLKEWLQRRALANQRSFNAEVCYRLTESQCQEEAGAKS